MEKVSYYVNVWTKKGQFLSREHIVAYRDCANCKCCHVGHASHSERHPCVPESFSVNWLNDWQNAVFKEDYNFQLFAGLHYTPHLRVAPIIWLNPCSAFPWVLRNTNQPNEKRSISQKCWNVRRGAYKHTTCCGGWLLSLGKTN